MFPGYIDPGAGSIILQTLIAVILGVAIFFRDTVKRVFRFIFPGRNSVDSTPDEPAGK